MSEKLHRISIQITQSQYKLLKSSVKPGVSISSLIRKAINKYLKEEWKVERNDFVKEMIKDLDRLQKESIKDEKVLL
mgnify:CR=1 FL=1|tara:strand:- start:293 stop:523 length:231 start_codon:yes stop_codon:yes gene_type:complete